MVRPKDFVHLHVHSEFSLLDGASRVKDIVKKASDCGMDAVAVTDHGNMYAAIKFNFEAKAAGIHPIIGCESYLAPRTRHDKNTRQDRSPYHLTLLAKDETGYHNLVKLISLANTEGFYQKPRLDKELLRKYGKGLVALSGCLAGEIPSYILEGQDDKIMPALQEYIDIFGDDFYLELMNNGLPEQMTVLRRLLELSKRTGVKYVATNDSHYTDKGDAAAQDTLMCIGTGRFLDEEDRMKFTSDQYYIKTAEEMEAAFPGLPEALLNTREIREKCLFEMPSGKIQFPNFPVPSGYTAFSYLKELAEKGISRRYGKTTPEIESRLKYELSIIEKMGYAPFFLIVADFINYAKDKGIEVGPGRGSAAGSIVSYSVGITDVDPLRYNLIFERFLNPERVTMPDIDTDFCFQRRQEVIDYVTSKYGSDHVAQIITFGTEGARNAIRDVGRVQRIPLAEVDRIAKMVPQGPDASIDNAMKTVKEFKTIYDSDAKIKNLIDTALTIEGLSRNASVHAAGVVISRDRLNELVPVSVMNETQIVTQYSMKDLEKIGLLKMDFLGLRNLTMIAHAIDLIEKKTGKRPDMKGLPLDDPKTYELLCAGNTGGVFQLESHGMRTLIKDLKPNKFEEVVALLALYRPGPLESGMVDDFIRRKHGQTKVVYELPELEPILKETYGVILYQEQVMQIASTIAGFSMGQADVLRHAMGKKNPREMAKQREKFMEGAQKLGFSQKKAKDLFDLCEKFAGYGFNKSHSTAYAIISFQTAYLKAHHPVEFMAALLTSIIGDSDKVTNYISECSKMGVKVLPPDINESEQDFAVINESIRFGLAAIKNVGFGAIDAVLNARKEGGSFKSFADFCGRIDQRAVNKKVIESLIKAGAFDSLGTNRASLLQNFEQVLSRAGKNPSSRMQTNLFGELDRLDEPEGAQSLEVPEFSREQILRMEKEMLGLYVSGHPLQDIAEHLEKKGTTKVADITDKMTDRKISVGGVLKNARKITTKKKDLMMVAVLEDLTGSIPLVVFPKTYEKYATYLNEDIPLIISGKVDMRNDEPQIICEEVEILDRVKTKRSLHIEISTKIGPEHLAGLKTLLAMYRGEEPTYIHIDGKIVSASGNYHTTISPLLIDEIEKVTGRGSAWIQFE